MLNNNCLLSCVLAAFVLACGSQTKKLTLRPVIPTASTASSQARDLTERAADALRAARTAKTDIERRHLLDEAVTLVTEIKGLLEPAINDPATLDDDRRRLHTQWSHADIIAWHAKNWDKRGPIPAFRDEASSRWEEMKKTLTEEFDPLKGKDTDDRLRAYGVLMQTLNAIDHLAPNNDTAYDYYAKAAKGLLVAEGSSQRQRLLLFEASVGAWPFVKKHDWQEVVQRCSAILVEQSWDADLDKQVGPVTNTCDSWLAQVPSSNIHRAWTDAYQRWLVKRSQAARR